MQPLEKGRLALGNKVGHHLLEACAVQHVPHLSHTDLQSCQRLGRAAQAQTSLLCRPLATEMVISPCLLPGIPQAQASQAASVCKRQMQCAELLGTGGKQSPTPGKIG